MMTSSKHGCFFLANRTDHVRASQRSNPRVKRDREHRVNRLDQELVLTTGFLVQNANLGSARHVRHVIDIGRFSVLYHKQGGNTHAKVIRVSDCDRRNHRHSLSPSLFSLIRRFRIVKGRIHRNACYPTCRIRTYRWTFPTFRNLLLSQN